MDREYIIHLKSVRVTAKNEEEARRELIKKLKNNSLLHETIIEDIEEEEDF